MKTIVLELPPLIDPAPTVNSTFDRLFEDYVFSMTACYLEQLDQPTQHQLMERLLTSLKPVAAGEYDQLDRASASKI